MSFSPIYRSGLRFLPRSPFNDKRLSARFSHLLSQMVDHQSNIAHQFTSDEAESRGSYRFFANKRVMHSELLEQISSPAPEMISSRDLVVIGDTTEISLKSKIAQIKDADRVGVLSDNKTPGYMAHANLVLDAQHGGVLGLSDLILWNRTPSQGSKAARRRSLRTRPWDEKESYRWLMGMRHSQSVLSSAKQILFVFDTEADFADLWEEAVPEKSDMLVRVQNHDRQIAGLPVKLFEHLESIEFCGQYPLEVSSLKRRNYSKNKAQQRQGRQTQMQFRYCDCKLQLRKRKKKVVPLYAIEAKEMAQFVPEGESPIQWYLLSTRAIESVQQARDLIRYYEWRWQIEQLFRLLKRKGFAIEQTELTSFDAILRQAIMSFGAAIRVMQLMRARDQTQGQDTDEVFSEQEQQCLEVLNQKLQGNTEKQQNPFHKDKLAWASWIIARLGGWKGYKSQHPPGPITFKRGWEKFTIYFDAWTLFQME